jgi:hypothetical protein
MRAFPILSAATFRTGCLRYGSRAAKGWIAVAAATVAVLAAEPVRRRIERRLERLYLGERGDPKPAPGQRQAQPFEIPAKISRRSRKAASRRPGIA